MTSKAEILDQLPINVDAEADTLCCIMLKPEIFGDVLSLGMTAADFHDPVYREIFGGMFALHIEGKPPEPKLVSNWLKLHTRIDSPAGLIGRIHDRQFIGTSGVYYAGIVLETAKRRQIHYLAESMLVGANNGKSIADVLSDSRDRFEQIATRGEAQNCNRLHWADCLTSIRDFTSRQSTVYYAAARR